MDTNNEELISSIEEANTEIKEDATVVEPAQETADKQPAAKKKGIGVGLILLIILKLFLREALVVVVLGVIFVWPLVNRYYIFPYQTVEDYYDMVDISLTDEEKLADLEALYENAFLGNPTCEERAELYGVDYEALYEEYQTKILETKNEFEYYCVLVDFVSYVGSGHNRMMYPHFAEVVNSGFQLNMEALDGSDTAAVYYTWEQNLKSQYREYWADCGSIRYVDGAYIMHGVMDESIWPKEYWGAKVLSIDGTDTIDFIVENPFYNPLVYDDIKNVTYRYSAYFNLTKGTPVVMELQLVDGSIVELEAFMDPYAECAMYVEYYDAAYVNNSDTDVITDNYELVECVEDDYIYLRIYTCMSGEDDERMVEELEDALTRHDKIIIDLRGNGGGLINYFTRYITPYVFEESIDIDLPCKIKKNELSTTWVSDPVTRLMELISFDSSDGYYHFTDGLWYSGGADKRNEVYILVDEDTYSSADMFTYAASTLDNVTVIGSHTGGEGIEGPIFMYSLPNSRLCYAFTPCVNEDTEGSDMLVGITPDVVLTESFEDRIEYMQLSYEGKNTRAYAVMMQYDDVLLNAIEYVKNAQ